MEINEQKMERNGELNIQLEWLQLLNRLRINRLVTIT